jgi:hypothetical protein
MTKILTKIFSSYWEVTPQHCLGRVYLKKEMIMQKKLILWTAAILLILSLSLKIYLVYQKTLEKAELTGQQKEEIKNKDEKIEAQHETIQTVKKSKIIAKNNAAIERDALIDKL